MKNLLEVREFDSITCNPDFQNEYAYLPEKTFRDLEEFIRMFAGDEDHADALNFLKIGYRRNVGDVISVSNYVGLIQMQNDYQIQVLPKIDFGEGTDSGIDNGNAGNGSNDDGVDTSRETKKIFLRMLRSMKDFPSKIFTDASLRTDQMNLYEIFINMYLQEVRTLVKHGLRSAYLTKEDNLNFFKGKLVINQQIRRNAAHGERFYTGFDEYQVNRPENRLVKATLLKLGMLSSSAENHKEIRQLLSCFELVNASTNYERDFSMITIDRSTRDYDMLMRWSKVFLLNQSFTTFSGGTTARALLFPMEKVFESYVAQELRKIVIELGWEFSAQDKGYYLFDSPRQFALRPDIVIRRDDGSIVVLDTKWKRLTDNRYANYGISQSDMYQMYVYSKKYQAPEIWLLYPVTEEMRGHSEIQFKSDDGVHVRAYFVDVANAEKSMRDLARKLKK